MDTQHLAANLPYRYCLPLIRGRLSSLRPSEQKVANYLLAQPAEVTSMTSVALGQRVGVSESTVIKCCQRLGFTGFSQLKMALVRELATTPISAFGEVEPDDSVDKIKEKVFHADLQALQDTAKVLDAMQLQRAATIIEGARKVGFFGVGASGIVAFDAQLKFMRMGIDAVYYPDLHAQMTCVATFGPEDAAVVVTHSGETLDVVEILRLACQAEVRTVCITNYPNSSAARLCDVVLLTSADEASFRSAAIASRIAQLAIIDCLFMTVLVRGCDEAMNYLVRTREAVASRKG